jgi:3-oxoacyl-[acyl-carrier-protein] synthase III
MNHHQKTIIESLGVYLPPKSVPTSEILSGCATPFFFPLERITGIKSRQMAGETEFSIDLSRKAVADCLGRSKYGPQDIDLLVCCNISRYDAPHQVSFEPSTAARLRHEFGFTHALAFDLTNACAGMFTGIHVVRSFLRSGAIRRGMVVSGEYITHLAKTAQQEVEGYLDSRMACLTLGDAGAALILENGTDDQAGFHGFDLQTFGRYSGLCIAKPSEQSGIVMYTDAVNLTDSAVLAGAEHALQMLRQEDWPPDSFQHLIMHQTSKLTLNSARNEINRLLEEDIFNDENTVNNLAERGNTASTSHFIALADQIEKGKINSGDKVVFSISASGLTIGTALYLFDDLPDRYREKEVKAIERSEESQNKSWTSNLPSSIRVRIESLGTIPEASFGKKNSLELLKEAAANCLEKSVHPIEKIDTLIYAGVYRTDYVLEPAYATLLAGELNMNSTPSGPDADRTFAFDVFNGSLGFLNACSIAQEMIASDSCQNAMIVTAECENNAKDHPGDLLGIQEAASAIILDGQASGDQGFSRFLFTSNGEAVNSYVTYGYYKESIPHLHIQKDAKLEDLYLSAILPAVREILEREGLAPGQIARIFPPQISSAFISSLSESLNIPVEKFVDVVGEGPDLFTSSIPYSMEYALGKGLVQSGDIGLIIAVGSGIQAGCAIYHF